MTDVFQVVVIFGEANSRLVLNFTEGEEAAAQFGAVEAALRAGEPGVVGVEDGYGARSVFRAGQVTAAHFIHVNSELNAQAEIAILQGHANASLQRRAAHDPALRKPGQGIVQASPLGGLNG